MDKRVELYISGQEYEVALSSDKFSGIDNIVGTGIGIVTYSKYELEPEIGYSQSSGHGEIIGYSYVYGDPITCEFELSEDPSITQKNILNAVFGTDEKLVVYQLKRQITKVEKK